MSVKKGQGIEHCATQFETRENEKKRGGNKQNETNANFEGSKMHMVALDTDNDCTVQKLS